MIFLAKGISAAGSDTPWCCIQRLKITTGPLYFTHDMHTVADLCNVGLHSGHSCFDGWSPYPDEKSQPVLPHSHHLYCIIVYLRHKMCDLTKNIHAFIKYKKYVLINSVINVYYLRSAKLCKSSIFELDKC